MIRSYVRDGHQDPDFAKKLSHMINQINNQAKYLIQNEITQIVNLSYKLEELFSSPFRMNEGGSGSLINISSIISFMAAFHHIDV